MLLNDWVNSATAEVYVMESHWPGPEHVRSRCLYGLVRLEVPITALP